ncbi:SDR family oxidoreductase [Escherichia albertii]|nr:SDR family oxidoreductase [Escherichia albertii]
MGKLTGKTALITGASQGIGEGIARTFARYGANLILLDISDEIERLADELGGRGHRCTAVIADVRDPASVAAAIKRAKEKEGRIDILVNNAGVCRLGSFLDMSDEDRDFHIDINIKGVWNVTKAVLPEMIARQSNPEDPESVLTEMAKAIPLRRLADPLEVGELAAFLASDESSYLTGTQNVIDGGSTLPESVSVGI